MTYEPGPARPPLDAGSGSAPVHSRQRFRSRALLAAAAAVLIAVAALIGVLAGRHGGGTTAAPGSTPTNSASATPQPEGSTPAGSTLPAAGTVKPPVIGAIDRQGEPSAAAQAAGIRNWVVQLHWRTLQPTSTDQPLQAGQAGAGGTADLDAAIAAAGNGKSRLKIRIYAGIYSPDWAKALGGGPIQLGQAGSGATAAVFWDPTFVKAYAHLMSLVAGRYDNTPQIGEIVICESGVVYCDATKQLRGGNARAYLAHGYTEAADIAAEKAGIDAHTVFRHTRSSMSFFRFQYVDPAGKPRNDNNVMFQLMDYGKQVLGKRWIEENNSASDRRINNPPYVPLWNKMRADAAAGWPIEYQTSTIKQMTSLCTTLQWATVTQKAIQVELPSGYNQAAGCALTGGTSVAKWNGALLGTAAAKLR